MTIGKVGRFVVEWESSTGDVYVSTEHAGNADTEVEAMSVAEAWVEYWESKNYDDDDDD